MASFFEFREKMLAETRRAAAPAPTPAPAGSGRGIEPVTVTALTRQIDQAIRSTLPERVYVRGELSNAKLHYASGHLYFTLKDAGACINGVMWKSDCARLKFKPVDGLEVVASGSVKVFAQKGSHQLYATSLQPLGQGALEIAFQQLCRKLEAEGLFDPARKMPLPSHPMRLALVTGSATAALADMRKVLARYPWIRLGIYAVPVQGEGSAEKIAAAINHLSHAGPAAGIEAILLARGGGSLEDRWAFNEEVVARAIADCRLPVVTGIGHEVDVSVADLVADYHAHTPTEAAQVIVGQWRIARDALGHHDVRLRRATTQLLGNARQQLTGIERHEVFRRPLDRIHQLRQVIDDRERALAMVQRQRLAADQRRISQIAERLDCHRPIEVIARLRERLAAESRRLDGGMTTLLRTAHADVYRCAEALRERHPRHLLRLEVQRLIALEARLIAGTRSQARRWHQRIDAMAAHLRAIGPEQVLQRGYSITMLKKSGAVVRSASQVKPGDRLVTRLADGQIESAAEDPDQPGLFGQ